MLASAEDFARLDTAFRRVVAASPDQRAAVLDESCGGDVEFRREVERLLSIDQSLPGFVRDEHIDAALGHRAASLIAHGDPVAMPAQIGQYAIIGLLGSGGMGAVYRARQTHPRREVALKVMRYGAMSRRMIRRFEFEADVLARLQHPGIAQVFEAGTWDDGGGARPFFAMELVDGRPLTRFANEEKLETPDRLRLLVSVCHAVEHAHQKGVVHRDLKPENILITPNGAPKILDFGIARATDSDVQVTTMSTHAGDLLGTLPYMSPEQVAGNAAEVDTRCDVYALGVILFELLAGVLPHDLNGKSIPDAARIIAQEDARSLRSVDARFVGDLDTITSKAMAKERDQRYASAGAMADDIERFLRDEPIAAHPATHAEHLRRFIRRNKTLAASIALTLISLALATAFSTWMAWREHNASELAQANADKASKQADRAQRVKDLMIGMFAPAYPARPNSKLSVEQMLAQASERVRTELRDEPDIEEEMLSVFGTIYQNLDLPQHAVPLLEDLLASQRSRGVDRHTLVQTLDLLGRIYNRDRDYESAARVHREALALWKGLEDEHAFPVIRAMLALAHVLPYVGEFDEAVSLCERAQSLLNELREPRPGQQYSALYELGIAKWMREDVGEALAVFRQLVTDPTPASKFWPKWYLAQALLEFGENDEAEDLLEELVAELRPSADVEPRRLGMALLTYAAALESRAAYDEAEAAAREAADILTGVDSAHLAIAFKRLASILHQRGATADALSLVEQAEQSLRILQFSLRDQTQVWILRAPMLASLGRFDEARAVGEQAVQAMQRLVPAHHSRLARPLLALSEVESLAGRPDAAADLLQDALDLLVQNHEPHRPRRVQAEDDLATALVAAGRNHEAREHLETVVAVRLKALGTEHAHTIRAMESLRQLELRTVDPASHNAPNHASDARVIDLR